MAMLRISRNGRVEGTFFLPDEQVVIGRADDADIQLLDAKVSRKHAVIRKSVAGFMIQDFTTRNGTWVNQESIDKSLLFHGDTVRIGAYELAFLDEDPDVDPLLSDSIAPLPEDLIDGLSLPPGLASEVPARASTVADGGPPRVRADRSERLPPSLDRFEPERAGHDGASVEFSMAELERVLDEVAMPAARGPNPGRARRVTPNRTPSPQSTVQRPPWSTSDPGSDGF